MIFKTPTPNYQVRFIKLSSFGDNYDQQEGTASTFFDLQEVKIKDNANCKNEFDLYEEKTNSLLTIQFHDIENWNFFKNEITRKAEFIEIRKTSPENPILLIYKIPIQIKNGRSTGIYVTLHEGKPSKFAQFTFNTTLD